jgi:SNF family Na+-dependent transporter
MWTELLKAVGAFFSFVFFPFVVIAAAASLLMLMDRLTHRHSHHGSHPAH